MMFSRDQISTVYSSMGSTIPLTHHTQTGIDKGCKNKVAFNFYWTVPVVVTGTKILPSGPAQNFSPGLSP